MTPAGWDSERPFSPAAWSDVPPLLAFIPAGGHGVARWPTTARLLQDDTYLYVRFECEDGDAWSTFERRDEPLHEQEAVEIFLAPGGRAPSEYFELQVSPKGVLFDARVSNPRGDRSALVTDTSWDCPGIRWAVGKGTQRQDWWAGLAIPWRALEVAAGLEEGGRAARVWRANLYRIERPRDGSRPELTAWCPTLRDPPDFHRPARFGVLRRW